MKVLYDTYIILCHIINPLIIVLFINKEKKKHETYEKNKPNMAKASLMVILKAQSSKQDYMLQKKGTYKMDFLLKSAS